MAKGTRICKVCGKEYEYCKTWNSTDKFRYQDVACSPEHGAIYFARIAASRSSNKTASEPQEETKPVEIKEEPKKAEIVDNAAESSSSAEEELSEEFIANDTISEDEEAVG